MADVTSRHRLDRRDRPEPPGAAVHTQLAWLGAKADILATSEREQRAVVPRVIPAVIGLEAEARTGAPRTWSRKMAARPGSELPVRRRVRTVGSVELDLHAHRRELDPVVRQDAVV